MRRLPFSFALVKVIRRLHPYVLADGGFVHIHPDHYAALLAMCREVAALTELPFDEVSLARFINEQLDGSFPEGGQSAAVLAVADPAFNAAGNASGLQFLVIACGLPQGRPGFDQPTLALKIVNVRTDPMGMMLEYDVFPDGRRTLECAGLFLDTRDELCKYEPPGTFLDDIEGAFRHHQKLGLLCLRCIETFPAGKKGEALRRQVFDECGISPN